MPFIADDVLQHVFSFLPIYDILVFASTSKVSMCSSIPDLHRRRENMKRDLLWKDCPLHQKFHYAEDSPFEEDEKDIYHVPSALDRIRCLQKSISNRHLLYDDLLALVRNIESDGYEEELFPYCDGCKESYSFEATFSTFQAILKAHKLHSLLLHRTIYDDTIHNGMENDISIYRFVGDVLIIYFLMGHAVSGIVEGVNESKWITKLSSPGNITPMFLWYQRFLCYHSTLLQTLPMTSEQMIRVGIANNGIISKMCRGNLSHDGCLISQSPYFRGTEKKVVLDHILSHEEFVTLSSTLYDFGPLGPAYRGRDNVRFMYLTPAREGVESIEVLNHTPVSQHNSSYNGTDIIASLRSDSFAPLTKLMNLFRDSRKTIPMNVRTGSVSVRVQPPSSYTVEML